MIRLVILSPNYPSPPFRLPQMLVRSRSANAAYGQRCTPVSVDAYSMDSVSVFHHSFRRKSKRRASGKSIKSFLNHAFDDPVRSRYLIGRFNLILLP